MKHGIFLPDLNNERDVKSEQYRLNLLSLDKFVMYRFIDDKTGAQLRTTYMGHMQHCDHLAACD